jgi:hypothetical protein
MQYPSTIGPRPPRQRILERGGYSPRRLRRFALTVSQVMCSAEKIATTAATTTRNVLPTRSASNSVTTTAIEVERSSICLM